MSQVLPKASALLVLTLCGSSLVPAAAAEPSAEEWSYLQRADAVGKVGDQLQKLTEDSGWANRELMAYARDLTRFNAAQVRRWRAPTPQMEPAHRQLIHLLDLSARHYEALALGNYADAETRGEHLKREAYRFMREWEAVMEHFEGSR